MPKKQTYTGHFAVCREGCYDYHPDFVRRHNKACTKGVDLPEDQGLALTPIDQDALLDALEHDVPWTRVAYKKYGKLRTTPRKTWCYGSPAKQKTTVRYQGVKHETEPIPSWALPLKSAIEKHTNTRFNAMLLNLYEDGSDHIGWHTDDERFLEHTTVASLSLGVERDFCVRDAEDVVHQLPLKSGSLCVLYGASHTLPKRVKQKGRRYNITFRQVRIADEQDICNGFGNYYKYCRGSNKTVYE